MHTTEQLVGTFIGGPAPVGTEVCLSFVGIDGVAGRTTTTVGGDGRLTLDLPGFALSTATVSFAAPEVDAVDLEPQGERLTEGDLVLWVGPPSHLRFGGA